MVEQQPSRTVTQVETNVEQPRTLVLRSEPETKSTGKPRRQVRWTEDVVDNEHMNKKKSKSKCSTAVLISIF